MAKRYTGELRRDAVRVASTSGLTRPQLSSDLGVGLSTLNKWVQQHQHDDLMSGPHEGVECQGKVKMSHICKVEVSQFPVLEAGLECRPWDWLL